MDGFRVTRHVEPICSLGEEETDQGHSECKCKAITKALNSSYFLVIYIWRVNQAKITEARQSAARLSFGKQLAQCDAVILCWASASEVWVRAQASGLRNWQELGRKQQFSYRAVVAAPPPGNRKKAGKLLFPRSDIDLVVDLSDKDIPTADLLDMLVPVSQAAGP